MTEREKHWEMQLTAVDEGKWPLWDKYQSDEWGVLEVFV
jgi:hypothetical protein